ncbi:rRNA maturation RNase YbeY [Candidatus Shapirobacteria bacterium]|nr:rRNA maturation RNase YbeY [Candidatus Shapirobacteria bacterium]
MESRYKVNRKRVITAVSELILKQNIVRDVEISLAIVGDRKMRSLNKQYRGKDQTTNVLSFSLSEGEATVLPPSEKSDVLRLGDVIISYPQVIQEAAEEEVLVDDKIDELVNHGVMHLLGVDHEE